MRLGCLPMQTVPISSKFAMPLRPCALHVLTAPCTPVALAGRFLIAVLKQGELAHVSTASHVTVARLDQAL